MDKLKAKQYRKVEKGLMKATVSLVPVDSTDKPEALILYLVGCAVSVLQVPTDGRCQEIYDRLASLAAKNKTVPDDVPQLTVDEVKVLIDAMRSRGELGFKSEEEIREACKVMTPDELVEIICAYWKKEQPGPH